MTEYQINRIKLRHASMNMRYGHGIPDTYRDEYWNILWDEDKLKDELDIETKVKSYRNGSFNSEYRMSWHQDEIDRIIRNIDDGFIYTEPIGHEDDITTCLAKDCNGIGLMYEKRITSDFDSDRLTYCIGKPYVTNYEGKKVLLVNVKLVTCYLHDRLSQRSHSEVDDELNDDFWSNHQLSDLNW